MIEIAGIDYKAGLENSAGNEKLLLKVLKIFKQRLDSELPKIEQVLFTKPLSEIQPEDIKIVYGMVHNFKGISGNLGAVELAIAAEKLLLVLEPYQKEKKVNFNAIEKADSLMRTKLDIFIYQASTLQTSLATIS